MTSTEHNHRLTNTIGLLSIAGVGRGRFHALISKFGSAANVFTATPGQLREIPGMPGSVAEAISAGFDSERVTNICQRVEQLGWGLNYCDADDFPRLLRHITARDIPPILFHSGKPLEDDEKTIAIVGTRHPSEHGKRFAHKLAGQLANAGMCVVSGMAEGIDSAAHRGAIEAGGRTVAVWGSSIDIPYPTSNRVLADQIRDNGAIYSEYMPGTGPDRAHFPERNRIISGLSEAVVVIEAGRKSGALITASCALQQSRELFSAPGPPGSITSEGSNDLIKQGASLITGIDDIYQALPRLKSEVVARQFNRIPELTDMEKQIVRLFSQGPLQVDSLSREADLPVQQLMEFLLALEMKGVVRELSGKRFVLADEYS